MSNLIQRVESKRGWKLQNTLKITSFLLFGIGVIHIFLVSDNIQAYRNIGFWVDTLSMYFITPILTLTFIHRKRIYSSEYIEWWNDKIVFRSKDNFEYTVLYKDISSIEFGIDNINISTDFMTNIINIENFTDYDMRKRIKHNFEQVGQHHYNLIK